MFNPVCLLTWASIKAKIKKVLFYLPLLVSMALSNPQKAAELEGAELVDRAGEKLALETYLIDEQGERVRVSDIFQKGMPVILKFAYFNCPMLCSLALNGLTEVLRSTPLKAGRDFQVISVSFDPRDTPKRAKEYGERYREAAGIQESESWTFFVGDQKEVKALANSAGFHFKWIEKKKEFAHGAALFFGTPEGILSRTLYGIHYRPLDFKLSVLEAKQKKSRSNLERALLYCFTYDPHENSYVLHAMNTMRIGALITVVVMGTVLFGLFKREKKAT